MSLTDLTSRIMYAIFIKGDLYHEGYAIKVILKRVNNLVNFVDIGSHVGYYSVVISKIYPCVQCLMFDVDKRCCRISKKNVLLNGLSKVTIINAAVSDSSNDNRYYYFIPFLWKEAPRCQGLLEKKSYMKKRIKSVKLDDYINFFKEGPSLIKIDIEGEEYNALRGMRRVLKEIKPILLIEIHQKYLFERNQTPQMIIDILKEHNYSIKEILNFRSPFDSHSGVEAKLAEVTHNYLFKTNNSMILAVRS